MEVDTASARRPLSVGGDADAVAPFPEPDGRRQRPDRESFTLSTDAAQALTSVDLANE